MSAIILATIVAVVAVAAFFYWMGQPIRYRGQTYQDFPEFLGPWPERGADGESIFLKAERDPVQLEFRISGNGPGKELQLNVPRSSRIVPDLSALAGPFAGASVRAIGDDLEFKLPAAAPYTGSLASRAAEQVLRSLGCSGETRFTIWARGTVDLQYALAQSERIADADRGWVSRWSRRRAARLRHHLKQTKRQPPGPAA